MNTMTESLSTPTTAEEAITFALSKLEPWELAEFLTDWRKGADLAPWLSIPDQTN